MASNQQCSFCSELAGSKEHVIPQWIQRHYGLKDQNLSLKNGTSIKYAQAVVPACVSCNSGRFARLERKIQTNTATKQDYYLWALKIRYGLAIRDSSLPSDRSKPGSGPILPREEAEFGAEFVKHAFRRLDDEAFDIHPNPFGSVFLFETPAATSQFDLIDVPPPFWALAITLPIGKVLVVLLADRGAVRGAMHKHYQGKGGFEAIFGQLPGLNARILMFQLLRWQNHMILPSGIRFNPNSLYGACPSPRVKLRVQKLDWYYEISAFCGLPSQVAEEAFIRDREIFTGGSIKCR